MVHRTSQVRVREGDSPERRGSQGVPRCRFSIFSEEKSRLRIEIRMAPAIQHNSRYVPLRLKPRTAEHFRKLLPDAPLIVAERRAKHLPAPTMPLLLRRISRIGVKNLQRQNNWLTWIYSRLHSAAHRHLAYIEIVSNAVKPSASRNPHLLQEPPVPHRDVHHHARRSEELRVSIPLGFAQVLNNMFCRPASSGHHCRAGLHAKHLSIFCISDRKGTGLRRI